MNKLLIICGPTATGKTNLALKFAHQFAGDLISADSRQVYLGMDVGTGKDIPKNFQFSIFNFQNKKIPYYSDGKVKIWGLDLVNPDEEFSVSHYIDFSIPMIKYLWQQGRLPIVVGGTGLYIKALTEPIDTVAIPSNKKLRKELESATVAELQIKLKTSDQLKFNSMNNSDQNNPRRLVRAIEVAEWKKNKGSALLLRANKSALLPIDCNLLQIGLTAPISVFKELIYERIGKRVEQNIISEIKMLLEKGYAWDLPALSGIGYRQWKEYFEEEKVKGKEESKMELGKKIIDEWKKDEINYMKRQMTWFKKEKKIHWFDITNSDYHSTVIESVEKWYTKNDADKD